MNQELKFRVYIPYQGRLVYFYLNEFCYSDRYLRSNEHSVQQYTGVKDIKGKEIYVGDIIRFIPFGEEHTRIGVIVFENACYMAKSFNDVPQGYHIYFHNSEPEVIGNIYELPCDPDHNGECMLCDEPCSECKFKNL